jgi:hypothetical protein
MTGYKRESAHLDGGPLNGQRWLIPLGKKIGDTIEARGKGTAERSYILARYRLTPERRTNYPHKGTSPVAVFVDADPEVVPPELTVEMALKAADEIRGKGTT